jgi:metallo-beta-lactamase family protein
MKVQFLGGVRTVTGSATLLEKGSIEWLVDCGMYQGGRAVEERNRNLRSYHAENLAFILLTHAHIDHSGLIPRLVKEGFRGKVICTKATFDLCEVMLRDSGHIQEMEAEWQNRKGKRSGKKRIDPLYTVKDAEASLRYFQPVRYDELFSPAEGIKVQFRDTGHILGSAIIEIWIKEGGSERKLVFSGDLGSPDQPIVRDPTWIEEADLLWLESTYGDRLHKSRDETVQELFQIIRQAIQDQAKVIIPAFAVERTQDVIFTLGQLIRKGLIPSIPVYIDSPLAIAATEIFKRNPDCFDRETREILSSGENPLALSQLIYTRTTEESRAINGDSRPGIIISASGMCDSGRILHHLKHHLWQESSHIVILGYQAAGSIGRRIVDGAKTVRLFGEEIAVKAHIHTLGGFSAHADQRGLLEWLSHCKTPGLEVLVNHGEEKISLGFAELIRQRLHIKATVPQWKEKRTLFGFERLETPQAAAPAREREDLLPPSAEPLSVLFRHLDRNYKKLRHRIRRKLSADKTFQDPDWVNRLEEINEKVKDLERER